MSKAAALMIKHNHFFGANLDDVEVMKDHFSVLLVLSKSHFRNGHCSGDKYPRYLRIFFGESGFNKQADVLESNRERARAIATRYVTDRVIHTQNIVVAGVKVNAMRAPAQQRQRLIDKLSSNFLRGFIAYAELLADLAIGRLRIPGCRSKTPSRLSSSSTESMKPCGAKRTRPLCDPASPCARAR